jgi:hypothetical protein
MKRHWVGLMALTLGVGSWLAPHCAQARPHAKVQVHEVPPAKDGRATIVSIEDGEVVMDVGADHGLQPGKEVALYRTVRAKHPVTGAVVEDRFLVGRVKLDEVAGSLSIVRPPAAMVKMLHPGDSVEYEPELPAVPAPVAAVAAAPSGSETPAANCPACPTCPPAVKGATDPETTAVTLAFRQTLGRTPQERIVVWRAFLGEWPAGKYAQAARGELNLWAQDLAPAARSLNKAPVIEHRTPGPLRVGEEIWLTFAASDWQQVADVRVHVRTAGEGSYVLFRPEPSGRLQRRLRLPDAYTAEAKGVQYMVEIGLVDGGLLRFGSAQNPLKIEVEPSLESQAKYTPHSTTFRIGGEYVDFNRFRDDDREVAGEAELVYRLQDPGWLYAFGIGYGVMNGVGGNVAESDQFTAQGKPVLHTTGPRAGLPVLRNDTMNVHSASFKYSWLSAEFALHPIVHVLGRLVIGVSGSQASNGIDAGVEGYLRLGLERGTNLRIGGSTLADMGRAGSLALTTNVVERLPMTVLIEATNRPVAADIGLRLIYEATWWATDGVGVTARIGYNLRTIEHVGMSTGGGLTLRW